MDDVRINRVHVKFNDEELAVLDKKRGNLTRSAFIRLLVENAKEIKITMKK